jgi:hypothetical protein
MISIFLLIVLSIQDHAYFRHPVIIKDQIFLTDNHYSSLYAIKDNQLSIMISKPGSGKYFSVSSDGKYIGFKLINEQGLQSPALYDIDQNTITRLHEPRYQCGQVSFAAGGVIAFTIGSELIIKNTSGEKHYDLDTYANLAPISPNGHFVVYNDDQDRLWLLDLEQNTKTCITQKDKGFCRPIWSPNSCLIVYSSLNGMLYVYDIIKQRSFFIGHGLSPDWSSNSQYLIFHRITTNEHEMIRSDLYLSQYNGQEQVNLTATPDIHEMDPRFCQDNNTVCYHTYESCEIYKAGIKDRKMIEREKVFVSDPSFTPVYHKLDISIGARDSIDVPYLHQVYDVPDWFNGHWACAPTTAMMAIAYYSKLPEWDCWCSSPYGHTSHFGRYLCELYHYFEVDYNLPAQDPSGNWAMGGYGYMWSGTNRPYTHMAQYLINHGITSWRDDTPTFEETIAEVNAGYPYGMCVGLTSAGHLVLAVGQVLDWHTLIFNDPYGNKNTAGYPSYDGKYARYDWPGYNNNYENLETVYWCVGAHGDRLTGFNGHMWWTYTTASTDQDTCYAVWTPDLTGLADYGLYAYIPADHANATAARYYINTYAGTTMVVIDQSNYSDEWAFLGMFGFMSNAHVRLGDATGTQGQHIAFDAMYWEFWGPGIKETKAKKNLSPVQLRSNVVSNMLYLNLRLDSKSRVVVAIYDITGRCQYHEDKGIINPGMQQLNIDISHTPAGIYMLKTTLNNHEIFNKYIVVR